MSVAAMNYGQSGSRRSGLRVDSLLLALVSATVLLGLIMVTSASITLASRDSGQPFDYLFKQLLLVVAGCGLAAGMFLVPIAKVEKLAMPLLLLAGVMLLLVLTPLGHSAKGASRWLRFAGVSFQVSEAARVLTLIYVASYCVRFESALRAGLPGFLRPMALLCLLAVLLLLEPDFGAATVLVVTGFGLLFLAGAQLRWVAAALLVGPLVLAALVMSSDYRMRRWTAFLDPWADPLNTGYQVVQSLIAVGRGEWFGVGLGASVQKLFYLPEAHNDFLFAVLAEELGLVGVVLTLALFLALTWRVLSLAQRANLAGMKFHSYLAAGFGLWLGVQAFANIGVNMGVLPNKGFTLPLMSYGRSSMLVTLAWLGLILRVHHEVASSARSSMRERSGIRERAA